MEKEKFMQYLRDDCGYLDVSEMKSAPHLYQAIMPLMFTHAIIVGTIGNEYNFDDRWCYHSYADAKKALDAWDGAPDTEPKGWHRHPATGRRLSEDGTEYINP